MNNVYALYIILSAKNNQPYIVSRNPKEITPPCEKITVPHKLQQESRYILKNFFIDDAYKFSEECSYNFLYIQEENTIDYARSTLPDFQETNLYLTYGGISSLHELKPNLYWHKLVFNNEYFGYTNNKSLNLLIDNVIHKTTF